MRSGTATRLTERRNVRVMLQNIYRRSPELRYALSSAVEI